jgi:Arc/MetJ-type ribon-helix-helix transcriptional regulator
MPRGRPPTGRNDHKAVTVYLAPADIAALDRLADRRTVRTGKSTSRSDLVREAVKLLLERDR